MPLPYTQLFMTMCSLPYQAKMQIAIRDVPQAKCLFLCLSYHNGADRYKILYTSSLAQSENCSMWVSIFPFFCFNVWRGIAKLDSQMWNLTCKISNLSYYMGMSCIRLKMPGWRITRGLMILTLNKNNISQRPKESKYGCFRFLLRYVGISHKTFMINEPVNLEEYIKLRTLMTNEI